MGGRVWGGGDYDSGGGAGGHIGEETSGNCEINCKVHSMCAVWVKRFRTEGILGLQSDLFSRATQIVVLVYSRV